jgi:hypothetical protein
MSGLYASLRRSSNLLIDNPSLWLRPLLVVGLLLLSAASPLLLRHRFGALLLVAIPALGAAMILLRRPALGLIALIAAGLIVPMQFGQINASVIVLAALIGLWLLDMVAVQRRIWIVPSRTYLPLLGLVTVTIVSFFVGQFPWFIFAPQSAPLSAQLGGLAIFILSAGAFLLVANQVKELRWLEWMTWIFIILGGSFITGWIVSSVGQVTGRLFQVPATGGSSMFWTWLVALSFSQAVFNRKLRPGWRLALGGVAVATLYVGFVLNSGWKSGYLPPLVAVAVIISLRSWRTALAMVPVAAIGFWYLTSDAVATDEYSYSTRIDAWIIMLEIIKASPILGFGPANYYYYTPLFRIRGYFVPFNSHSQYFDIVAQVGLLGLAFFLWFFAEVGRLGWRLRTQAEEGFARAYVFGVLGGVAGTVVAAALADWVIPFVYNIGFSGFRGSILAWLFMGGLVSIDRITSLQAQAKLAAAEAQ